PPLAEWRCPVRHRSRGLPRGRAGLSRRGVLQGGAHPNRRPQSDLYSRRVSAKLLGMPLFPSPDELAREAQEILARNPMTSKEHIEFLIREGIIDRQGRVLRPSRSGRKGLRQKDGGRSAEPLAADLGPFAPYPSPAELARE